MIYFIGDRPSKRTNPDVPFQGASCEKRLKDWIKYLKIKDYTIVNQCDLSDNDIQSLYFTMVPIIALGNAAANRLFEFEIPHFKLPHPSGRNRQINDKNFIVAKLDECKKYLESTKVPR